MKRHSWIGTAAALTKEPNRSKLPCQSKLPRFTVPAIVSHEISDEEELNIIASCKCENKIHHENSICNLENLLKIWSVKS